MTDQELSLAVGLGGWVEARWHTRALPEQIAYVRFAVVDASRWRIVELRLLDPSQEALRALPLSRIEHAANAHALVALGLAAGHTTPAPDDVPAFFKTSRRRQRRQESRYKLERPAGRRLSDDFYEAVARAYQEAVTVGLNPRKTLAEDSGTPADTVARWILEARKRGSLPPAAPGKVGA